MPSSLENRLNKLNHYADATFASQTVKLLASTHSLPNQPIDNNELTNQLSQQISATLARKAHIIGQRLGIEQRYLSRSLTQAISAASPTGPELGSTVINRALAEAKLSIAELGYLIGHTTSPETLLPPNIAWVAELLNCQAPYLELRQACTGFANGLQIACAMLASPATKPIAIMGSEVGSVYFDLSKKFIDTKQLVNFMQMGDGAGAVVLASNIDNATSSIISDCYIGHIGNGKQPGFALPYGGARSVACPQGLPHFDHQVVKVKESGEQLFLMGLKAILSRGYHLNDFAYIIPHQVNGHIDVLLSEQLAITPERIINDAKWLGNLGSAAIWVGLDRLRKSGKLAKGDKVLVLGAEATKYLYGGFVYTH